MAKILLNAKILDLPLKKKWYEMIESGVKKEEYREIKPYWLKRLFRVIDYNFTHYEDVDSDCAEFYTNNTDLLKTDLNLGGFHIKDFTHVRFRYGYTNRTMTYKIDKISIGVGKPKWGAPKENVIIISIGNKVTHF